MMLTAPAVVHPRSSWKLAIVTGLSQPNSCALSDVQLQFLDGLEEYLRRQACKIPPHAIVRRNFPFVEDRDCAASPPNLWRASFANLRQYLFARTVRYRQQAAFHWQTLLDSSEQTNLITGSCGLELLVRCLESLRIERPLNVLALGPVANYRLVEQLESEHPFTLHTVCGDRDWIASRWLRPRSRSRARPREQDCWIASLGHLGYWTNRAVEAFACKWLFARISESQGAAVTCPLAR